MSEKATAGVIGTVAAVAYDLIAYGGEFIVATVAFLVQDPGMLMSFVASLSALAGRVEWLPQATVEQVYVVILTLVVLLAAFRLARAWYRRVVA